MVEPQKIACARTSGTILCNRKFVFGSELDRNCENPFVLRPPRGHLAIHRIRVALPCPDG